MLLTSEQTVIRDAASERLMPFAAEHDHNPKI
jgi:hypothetical protein